MVLVGSKTFKLFRYVLAIATGRCTWCCMFVFALCLR